MSEPQETRIGRKQERIEKPQASSSKTRKVYVLGVAFVAVLLLGASFGIMISATTPSIPTVIEPGSMVTGADYVVFADGGNYYAKNGTTGALAYSNASAYTTINNAIHHLGGGGIIAFSSGIFNLGGTDLIIDVPGVILQGSGDYPRTGLTPITTDTRLTGNVYIEAENVKIRDLTINGRLTLTSTGDLSSVAHYIQISNVDVKQGISFIGLPDADPWYVPHTISIEDSFIQNEAFPRGNVVTFINPAPASIDHIVFQNTVIDQQFVGDMIYMNGYYSNICFQNCLLMTYAPNAKVFNYSQSMPIGWNQVKFIGCQFELGDSTTVFSFNAPIVVADLDVQVIGGWFITHSTDITLVYSNVTLNGFSRGRILFQSVWFDTLYTIRMDETVALYQDATTPIVARFADCMFERNVTFQQLSNCQSIGQFSDCLNVNPRGLMTTPITAFYSGNALGLLGTINSWNANTNYTIADVPMAITVTGGTGVSINIYDPEGYDGPGVLVASGLTTLNRMYLPIGYKINLGNFTVAPTVIVEGL
jgi:hypothetical protein